VRLIADRDPDRSDELRVLEENDMIGGLSLLGDFRRLETAETATEAQVLGFFRPDLKNVRRRNPEAGTEIIAALARQLAAQHVELVRRYEDRADALTALQTYTEAAEAVEPDVPAEV
jgi:CRP-like cAMP-binding protein